MATPPHRRAPGSVSERRLTLRALLALVLAVVPPFRSARAWSGLNLPPGARKCPNTECGYVYDPALGDPDAGVPPGTAFEDLPDDWMCPECGLDKYLW